MPPPPGGSPAGGVRSGAGTLCRVQVSASSSDVENTTHGGGPLTKERARRSGREAGRSGDHSVRRVEPAGRRELARAVGPAEALRRRPVHAVAGGGDVSVIWSGNVDEQRVARGPGRDSGSDRAAAVRVDPPRVAVGDDLRAILRGLGQHRVAPGEAAVGRLAGRDAAVRECIERVVAPVDGVPDRVEGAVGTDRDREIPLVVHLGVAGRGAVDMDGLPGLALVERHEHDVQGEVRIVGEEAGRSGADREDDRAVVNLPGNLLAVRVEGMVRVALTGLAELVGHARVQDVVGVRRVDDDLRLAEHEILTETGMRFRALTGRSGQVALDRPQPGRQQFGRVHGVRR